MTANRPHEIAVFGATGYTGRRIVRELAHAGHDVVCVGRDRARLAATAARVGRPVRVEVAHLRDGRRLKEITNTVTTVVNAAGSFVETCAPIARAAIATSTHYVDISGEQRSLALAYGQFDQPAADAGVALVASSAFYAALADMLVPIAAAGLDHVDTVDIVYDITNWTPSGAAYDNFIRGIGFPAMQFDHGYIDVAAGARRIVDFGSALGRQTVLSYPAPEILTIPRHINVDRLRTSITASTFNVPLPVRLVPTATRAIAVGLRSPANRLVAKALSLATGSTRQRIEEDPTTFRIAVRIQVDSILRTATLTGAGIFDITAPIAARIAELTLSDSFDAVGALTPAQVAEPSGFLNGLAARGLSYRIGA